MDYYNKYQLMLVLDCGDYTSKSKMNSKPQAKACDLWT